MRAALVGLPGHVILRLHESTRSVLVDPFHRGAALSQRDCMKYLADYGLPFNPRWFDDADDASMLRRQVANLANSLRRRSLAREVELLERVGRALEARLVAASRAREGGSP
jgi:regulator of sirC expression with transglutaminase-like and TPR domain